jgi:hypothetical protein
MSDRTIDEQLIHLILSRLERISADSIWAHRASGIRGALLKLSNIDEFRKSHKQQDIQYLLSLGFDLLEKDAQKRIE